MNITDIVDRIGSGDAFCSGVLHGLINRELPNEIVNFATAAAMKHTVHGDCNQFSTQSIIEYMNNYSKEVRR